MPSALRCFDRILPYKSTGTFVLKAIDELMAVLDEHITMTQAMMFSAYKKPFEERIDDWNRKLYVISEVIEAWLAVQRDWMYLQPIFESPDINKQLPAEGKKFATVNKNWCATVTAAKARPVPTQCVEVELQVASTASSRRRTASTSSS